ncbi:hypothetical protein [Sediminitomix flava]|uniref:Uncharacterized protein n=1 Tax=Sediminitomix flava TaxID=379075 RepID=A0A315Z6H6_SEDFL|nr:hypothetical protein [Sediminitomix flava]PWJ37867.1 hypothetical protein BC781_1082 [Sediminitomix flava]
MRKLTVTILTLTLIFLSSCNVSMNKIDIWTEQATVTEIIGFENSLSEENQILEMNIFLSKSIYPLIDEYKIAKPIIFKRENAGFLPLYTQYFYSESDSMIRYISYDWEKEMYGDFSRKQEVWKEESKKLEEYDTEYDRIKLALVEKLGEPTIQDEEPQKIKSNSGRGDCLSRNTVWETDKYYSKLNLIFESMTYRLRWYHYLKK